MGAPSSTTRPPPSTYVWSEMRSAALARCSTSKTVEPKFANPRMYSSSNYVATIGAKFAVGSSSTNTDGESISTRPIASILRSPPESLPA